MTIAGAPADGLHRAFFESAAAHPGRPALEVGTETLTYGQLRERVLRVAHALVVQAGLSQPRVGVLASRSTAMYAGILGALASGGAVVPLNPGFPAERTHQMIELAEEKGLPHSALDEIERRLSLPHGTP